MMAGAEFKAEKLMSTFTEVILPGAFVSTSPFPIKIVTGIPESLLIGDIPPRRGAG